MSKLNKTERCDLAVQVKAEAGQSGFRIASYFAINTETTEITHRHKPLNAMKR
jgi:hypothetical protein